MKTICYLIMIVFLFSCNPESKKDKDHLSSHSIPLEVEIEEDDFKIPNELENARYLSLESKENNRISSVDKLQFFNNRIFIFDEQQNKIFIFDDKGRFLNPIEYKGSGPNEYLYLSDFLIDKQDSSIELLDVGSKKVLQLDHDFKVKRTIKIPVFCKNFLKNNRGEYLFFTDNQNNTTQGECYNFIQTDKVGKEIKKFFLISNEKKDLIIGESHSFTTYEGGSVFSLPVDNHIYHIRNDSVFVGYTILFGKFDTPVNILDPLKRVNDQEKIQVQMKIFNDIVKKGYAYSIHSVMENKMFLFFQFRKGKDLYSVLYNKKKKQLLTGRNTHNNATSFILGQPVAINEKNELVTVIFPYELSNIHENTQNKKENGKSFISQSGESLKTIGQFDNPIIGFIPLMNSGGSK